MAEIKVEDVLNLVVSGFEVPKEGTDDEAKAALKAEFEKRYVGTDVHQKEKDKQAFDLKFAAEAKLKQVAKKYGLTDEEIKGKKFDDLYSLLETKADSIATEIATLKESNVNTDTGEGKKKLEALQKRLDEVLGLDGEKDKRIHELNEQLEQAKADGDSRLEAHILNKKVDELFDGANWTDDSDKIVKRGVRAEYIDGRYVFKAEGEKVLVYNNDTDQTMVKDGVNQMTAEKLFEDILKKVKRFKENKGNPDPKKPGTTGPDGKVVPAKQLSYQEQVLAKRKSS